ncbi:MAG: zinc-binding dehydrogenase [Dehalococcoidia bacterium]
MKAVYFVESGPPDVLIYGDLSSPEPGPNDVLIRVKATSLDRLDIFTREGSHGTAFTPPHVPGRDIAGEVVEVGVAVEGIAIGARVVARGRSSCAEYALAPARSTFPLPENCSFEEGGALPTAGETAYTVLMERAHLRPGEDVLVMAAGSGVSHYAVQIAKAAGARVIATVGTEEKRQEARALGADETINHYEEDIAARVMEYTSGQGVDVIVEHVGAPVWEACVKSLKPYGRFVTCGVTAGHRVELHLGQVFVKGIQIMGVGPRSDHMIRESMQGLLRLVSLGLVRSRVHSVFPLAEAAEAHRLMESSGFFGKIVLTP